MTVAGATPNASPRVFGIAGTAYCGSTILSLALGASPDVFAVGELQDLFDRGTEARCRTCPRTVGCRFWTRELLDACLADPRKAYDRVAQAAAAAGTALVLHADKAGARYRAHAATNRFDGLVVLFKRPAAYVYSATRHDRATVDLALATYASRYEDLLEWSRSIDSVFVAYDRFAGAPDTELARLCSALDVAYDDGMLRFWERKARLHVLSGNAGALSQLLNDRQLAEAITRPFWQETYSPAQIEWVQQHHRAIVLDDKWRRLEPEVLAEIDAHEAARAAYRELLTRA